MYTIAEKLTDYVIQNGNIKDEERSIYVYGFQVALEQTVCYVICFFGSNIFKGNTRRYYIFYCICTITVICWWIAFK